jgi:2-dehydro-3-deoxyphosphogluconate aldolase/(4S)-4-hydroxy-2-oxoglutarate aldolase
MATLDDALNACPVIGIVRASGPDHIPDVLRTVVDRGLRAVEVALTTPGALAAIRAAALAGHAGLTLGAGTVLDRATARAAVDAGAQYLVTPAVLPEVITEGVRLGIPVVAGALTPTEVLTAWRAGAAMVKLFPADGMGGPAYVRALLAPLPEVSLVPTGGVGIEDAASYLRAGARAVGIGGPLIGDAAEGGDLDALARRVTRLVTEIDPGRHAPEPTSRA